MMVGSATLLLTLSDINFLFHFATFEAVSKDANNVVDSVKPLMHSLTNFHNITYSPRGGND